MNGRNSHRCEILSQRYTTDPSLIPTKANVPPLFEDSAGVSAQQDNMASVRMQPISPPGHQRVKGQPNLTRKELNLQYEERDPTPKGLQETVNSNWVCILREQHQGDQNMNLNKGENIAIKTLSLTQDLSTLVSTQAVGVNILLEQLLETR